MILCENCLERTEKAKKVPVGYDRGTQRDPWRIERILCEPCEEALLGGRWDVLHDRYATERVVSQQHEGSADVPH